MNMYMTDKIPYISQMPDWPTGCESVSTVMLLNYLDIDVTVDEFISYLPMKSLYTKDGKTYGYSPREYFIGSPYNTHSFGCYAEVIINTVHAYANAKNLPITATDISSLSTEVIADTYLRNHIPVLYWATIDLKPSRTGPSWILEDRNEIFTWISNEHCMLMVGENTDGYVFLDPWNNNGIKTYPKELVQKRHAELLSMAVAISYGPGEE